MDVSVATFIYYYLILVILISSGNVFIPGVNPVLNCGSASDATITITSVQWLINGTPLEDLSFTNVETEFSQISRQGTLVFNNISVEYNNTNIQCRANSSNGETVDYNNAILLVQGEMCKLVVMSSYYLGLISICC